MTRDLHRMDDGGSVVVRTHWTDADGVLRRIVEDLSHPPVTWRASAIAELRAPNPNHPDGIWSAEEIAAGLAPRPFEIVEARNNLLLTQGANDLWNGLSTAGLSNPYNTTNAYLAVGDGSTAAAVGNTDLSAAAGSNIATSGLSAATNATPIVITNGSGNWSSTPSAGQVVVVASVNGNTAANGTFEVQSSTATTITLKNSAGNGSFTSSGSATVKVINRYLAQANASGSAVVSTNQIVYVASYGTSVANFAWNEWGLALVTTTNLQAAAPTKLFNRAVPASSLLTKTSSATATLTVTLSLA
jgi:hypothetical protein